MSNAHKKCEHPKETVGAPGCFATGETFLHEKESRRSFEESIHDTEVPLDIISSEPSHEIHVTADDVTEFDMDTDPIMMEFDDKDPPMRIRSRDDVYYEIYLAAKTKAQVARDLAIQSFLEAKRIQNMYQIIDTDPDLAPPSE
jgi:hypothetical protein